MGSSDFLCFFPPCLVSFARRHLACASSSFLPCMQARPARAWALLREPPVSLLTRKAQDLPGSWGTSAYVPRSSTPVEPLRQVLSAPRCCLPLLRRRRPPQPESLGAQSRGPHARCLRFAARVAPAPRKTRFRLPTCLAGRGSYPARSHSKVLEMLQFITSSFARLSWRTLGKSKQILPAAMNPGSLVASRLAGAGSWRGDTGPLRALGDDAVGGTGHSLPRHLHIGKLSASCRRKLP